MITLQDEDARRAPFRCEIERARNCPACRESCSRTALTKLLYTFEGCSCPSVEYRHIAERVWHVECYRTSLATSEALPAASKSGRSEVEEL